MSDTNRRDTEQVPRPIDTMTGYDMLSELLERSRRVEVRIGTIERELHQVGLRAKELPEEVVAAVRSEVANLVIELVTRIEVLEDFRRCHDFPCDIPKIKTV